METKQLTILKALENIHNASEKSKLKLEDYEKVNTDITYVCEYFKINEIESILLASFTCLSCLDEVELREVMQYIDLEKIEFLPYFEHLKILLNKNILGKIKSRSTVRDCYFLKDYLIGFIIKNTPIPPHLIKHERHEDSLYHFLSDIEDLSKKKEKEDIDYLFFKHQYMELLEINNKYKLVNFAVINLEPIDSFVLFKVILKAIEEHENDFNSYLQDTVDDFTNRVRDTFNYVSRFLEGKTKLNKFDLIEKDKTPFSNRHKIQLTKKALKMLYDMEGIKIGYADNKKNEKLLYPEKIQQTTLYYNPSELQQLEPVLKTMSNIAFNTLQQRLKKNNLPSGVTTLLYGKPGTGKTETVYQLAKKYNRPVFKVEISETKSAWFGESQKLVKKIFTDYYEMKEQEKVCPILLFNEADAVIGKRKNAGSSAVADTENAIQNILLEELENFDGILFATSNLVENLDSAFERRFLFKIKFDSPSSENAAKIWKNKIPVISKKEAEILANKFKFSGGEMENIARKCVMEEVVLGRKLTFDKILTFCENEKWNNNSSLNKIGF